MWNNQWKKGVDYPEWGDNEVYKKTIGATRIKVCKRFFFSKYKKNYI